MSSEILAQYCELYIGGYKINDAWMALVQDITFEDVDNGSDLLTINMADPHLAVLNSPHLFLEEQAVKFIGGWTNNYRVMFQGYISVIDIDYPESGQPTVAIHCMDNTHLMNRTKHKKTWEKKKKSDVAFTASTISLVS